MTRAMRLFLTTSLLLLGLTATASAAPVWRLQAVADSYVKPGATFRYTVFLDNVGDEPSSGEHRLRVELPAGVRALEVEDVESVGWSCTGDGPGPAPAIEGAGALSCASTFEIIPIPLFPPPSAGGLGPEFGQKLIIVAAADLAASGPGDARFEIGGGNASRADGSACGQPPGYDPPPCATSSQTTIVTNDDPQFGVEAFDLQPAGADGSLYTTAGGHPHDVTTHIDLRTAHHPVHDQLYPVEAPKDIVVDLPAGLVGNATALPQCTIELLAQPGDAPFPVACPGSSQVGVANVRAAFGTPSNPPVSNPPFALPTFIYNMRPPAGGPARFGINIFGTIVVIDPELKEANGEYKLSVVSRNTSEGVALIGSSLTFWGSPADPSHDVQRFCPEIPALGCASTAPNVPLLRMPTSCPSPGEGLHSKLSVDSWVKPGQFATADSESHEIPGFPADPADWGAPQGATDCEDVDVEGSLQAKPTTPQAETSSGLDVHLEVPNPGLTTPGGISSSDLKKVRVSLPQGVTINPSQAEGLGVCTPAQYESTELSFFPTPGKGCPDNSKIGSVSVQTPLLEETIPGEVFIAQQDDPTTSAPGAENPFDSLLALYIVLENPDRGILIKLPGKVETDESTGRIVTTFDDLPQLPFSSFDFKFREGARAPLVTPPTCGAYTTTTEITGWSDPDGPPLVSESSFAIDRGIGGGPCPPGGVPGFNPGFSAGSINNNAGSFSPVNMRLTRLDGEQNLTKFSATLPPGLLAKLAGVEKCSDAAIAAAKGKTGRAELAGPSCPPNSQIGRTLAGAGVGSVLTYVPGKLYLAGPYNGAPLSVAAIVPAVAGPFDVGTVVVREALDLDPRTAVASVDGAASDPIPHILKGIPLKLRDLRVYVDRDQFTLNPTSCDPSAVGATLWGSAADVFNPADDVPVARSSRFQAASCLNLGFKPRLKINLKGGAGRGAHPGLRAVLTPRPGDANIAKAVVKLPRSAFLDQSHIRTICTRVQFAADACPKAAIYGKVKAWSPLLEEPLAGPVYLRSSNNKLPDLVFDLHGLVDIEVAGRIDSVKGGIRTSFAQVPDAPISKVLLRMQGGRKGLIVNSRNLCAAKNRAGARFDGHNGKKRDFGPLVRARCARNR